MGDKRKHKGDNVKRSFTSILPTQPKLSKVPQYYTTFCVGSTYLVSVTKPPKTDINKVSLEVTKNLKRLNAVSFSKPKSGQQNGTVEPVIRSSSKQVIKTQGTIKLSRGQVFEDHSYVKSKKNPEFISKVITITIDPDLRIDHTQESSCPSLISEESYDPDLTITGNEEIVESVEEEDDLEIDDEFFYDEEIVSDFESVEDAPLQEDLGTPPKAVQVKYPDHEDHPHLIWIQNNIEILESEVPYSCRLTRDAISNRYRKWAAEQPYVVIKTIHQWCVGKKIRKALGMTPINYSKLRFKN